MILPNRKSIRLKEYDYSSNGAYFVTICTQNREILFGDILNSIMVLNNDGIIVRQHITLLSQRFPIQIPIYQIMPNHLHLMIMIVGANHDSPEKRAVREPPLRKRSLLSQIIGYLKMNITKSIHQNIKNHNMPIWQRNYFEHIIRNEKDLEKISEYIMSNPLLWGRDRNNPGTKIR